MIKIQRFENLGEMEIPWLHARYHFSFSNYYNPQRMGFGVLRVINDDIVRAKGGFDTHPHKDMEIITYVRKGAITHEDNKGNIGRTEAGDVQVMSAGSGIYHSEHNVENEDTQLYQIWIEPHTKSVKPSWEACAFPKKANTKSLPLLVSGRKEDKDEGALYINQYASIYGGIIKKDSVIEHPIRDQAYLLVSEGEINIDGNILKKGDGAEITKQKNIKIAANANSEIVLIDVPNK